MSETTEATIDTDARLAELVEEQERIFVERQPQSGALSARALQSLAGGATSSWMIARPQTVWISHGSGSKIYDVDGNEYVDLHGGYGVGLVGHGHPALVSALRERAPLGTHFAQPTEDAIVVAEELSRRFDQPLWRFTNSGTEATLDAFHLMRCATGRDIVLKVEGCYHGHHDSAMVSVANEADEIGPVERPASPQAGAGLPVATTDLTWIVHYNDLEIVERLLQENPGRIAGMILEPIMMNAGIIAPRDGYLEGLKELLHRHGALLTFDEVKTGLTVGPGGATRRLGVTPDLVTLAKAIGGGVPCGAIGGSNEVMGLIVEREYEQVGTFNGNPLTMAACRAVLTEILDEDAHAHVESLREHMQSGVEAIVDEHGIDAHVMAFGAKGCVTFSSTQLSNYRGFLEIEDDFSHLHWLFQHNGGVFLPPWGKAEQWTLSIQHSMDDARQFVDNFRTFAQALTK
ncbi:MAG TPA: aspartate aminotransferase family protein [Acidobacteriota bacterium]|nr:aspartate aminotransferase family protein [Acidobacteriota bacterium]